MRSSIPLRADQVERLERLAGLRGEQGIAHLVEEALDLFLAAEDRRRAALRRTFESLGSTGPHEVLTGRTTSSD